MRRRMLSMALVVVTAAALGLVVSTQAGAAYCGIRWGSLPKAASGSGGSAVVGVRPGRHDCYDRLVVDFAGPAQRARVRYVDRVESQGAGAVVALRGGAFLEIVLFGPADVAAPRNTTPAVSGFRTFRQVGYGGSFEGYTTIGLGVRARLPFRVFTLAGPGTRSRLVIDVAHRW